MLKCASASRPNVKQKTWNGNEFLYNEMVHLCQRGFVEETAYASVHGIKKKYGHDFNLHDFCRITEAGRKQLTLLDDARRLLSEHSQAGA